MENRFVLNVVQMTLKNVTMINTEKPVEFYLVQQALQQELSVVPHRSLNRRCYWRCSWPLWAL